MPALLDNIEIQTAANPTVAIIWMHGMGADGKDFVPIAGMLGLPEQPAVRFVFPHANPIPTTINNGHVMRAWYDMDKNKQEEPKSLRTAQGQIEALIARETKRGIPANRIILAGFSQGCAIALHTGLRYPEKLAGIMCLSGYVPLQGTLQAERSDANRKTPIFVAHGTQDQIIPLARASASRDLLQAQGYQVDWRQYQMQHTLNQEEIRDIGAWLTQVMQ